jgi:ATP adenylyltransferase
VIMNLFPYNSGHLMIVPYRHIPSLIDLNADESKELMELLQQMMRALLKVLRPDGFNVGTNVGRPAGAGIDQHVHLHVVPRWNGDTNFLPILADTKVISDDMRKTLADLRKAL